MVQCCFALRNPENVVRVHSKIISQYILDQIWSLFQGSLSLFSAFTSWTVYKYSPSELKGFPYFCWVRLLMVNVANVAYRIQGHQKQWHRVYLSTEKMLIHSFFNLQWPPYLGQAHNRSRGYPRNTGYKARKVDRTPLHHRAQKN